MATPQRATSKRRRPRDRVPRPWLTDEDEAGWVADGTSDDVPRGPVRLAVLLELDAEQTEWVHRASTAAGLDYVSFLTKLIDDVRAGQTRQGGTASGP